MVLLHSKPAGLDDATSLLTALAALERVPSWRPLDATSLPPFLKPAPQHVVWVLITLACEVLHSGTISRIRATVSALALSEGVP